MLSLFVVFRRLVTEHLYLRFYTEVFLFVSISVVQEGASKALCDLLLDTYGYLPLSSLCTVPSPLLLTLVTRETVFGFHEGLQNLQEFWSLAWLSW